MRITRQHHHPDNSGFWHFRHYLIGPAVTISTHVHDGVMSYILFIAVSHALFGGDFVNVSGCKYCGETLNQWLQLQHFL